MGYSENLEEINIIIYTLKLICISLGTYYVVLKSTKDNNIKSTKNIIITIIIAIACEFIEKTTNSMNTMLCLMILLSVTFARTDKDNIGYYILTTTICLSLNYIIFLIAVAISYFPNYIMNIRNNYISFIIIISIYYILLKMFFKIKRFNKGFSFLKEKLVNEYFNVLVLNISIIILFLIITLYNYQIKITGEFGVALIIFSIIMFITIQKSIKQYYKQKMLIQELKETKEELENKKAEIKELEQENLNFSKTSHTIAHSQKSIEHKLNELMQKSETAEEIEIASRVEKISKEIRSQRTTTIVKTTIPEIDNILKYMKTESEKNHIDYQVQIKGNLYHMTNNYIEKQDLEILLADHIKNAIIAINHSKNTNKSILVRIGLIDGIYGIHIYDTGIEFEPETLKHIGKKPSTTHADEGGTGMGFMNTFETLKKYKASMEIREIGKPSKDNYTKIIIIKFDQKNEFKISSYRQQEIGQIETTI